MERVLVVGVDSVAGANLALALSQTIEVRGLSLQRPLELKGVPTQWLHLRDEHSLAETIEAIQPDWILQAGSLSASSWDLPQFSEPVWEREIALADRLGEVAKEQFARFAVISTDAVFGGPRLFHDEESATSLAHPAAAYALRLERAALAHDALVVRTHVYGLAPFGSEPGLVERLWTAIHQGTALDCDGRRYATPLLASDLAKLLMRACQLKLQGLYHLTGAERTSSFRMACELAALCGKQVSRLRMDPPASDLSTTIETSLASRRARRTLERPLPLLREGLESFLNQAAASERYRTQYIEPAPLREFAA